MVQEQDLLLGLEEGFVPAYGTAGLRILEVIDFLDEDNSQVDLRNFLISIEKIEILKVEIIGFREDEKKEGRNHSFQFIFGEDGQSSTTLSVEMFEVNEPRDKR